MKTKFLLVIVCFSALILFGFQVLSPTIAFTLTATIDIAPDTINLYREGNWITVYILSLPEGYNISDIDRTNINLTDDAVNPTWSVPAEWSSMEGGVLMVKFDSSEVISHLWTMLEGHMGRNRPSIPLTVVGFVKGPESDTAFAGSDSVTILDPTSQY